MTDECSQARSDIDYHYASHHHERFTQADRTLESRIRTFVRGEPKVQHFIDTRT
jgi:hypothetical protein